MPIDLQSLTRKQKRVKDWSELLAAGVPHTELKNAFTEKLKLFRNLLAKCWESEKISEEDEMQLEDLERQLEQLAEETRLAAR